VRLRERREQRSAENRPEVDRLRLDNLHRALGADETVCQTCQGEYDKGASRHSPDVKPLISMAEDEGVERTSPKSLIYRALCFPLQQICGKQHRTYDDCQHASARIYVGERECGSVAAVRWGSQAVLHPTLGVCPVVTSTSHAHASSCEIPSRPCWKYTRNAAMIEWVKNAG
jgi:hypothetical protein